jgi:RNA polymerase sigma-70 factor (ECF subfamily)
MAENKTLAASEQNELIELVRAAKADPLAFGELYRRFVNPVFKYLCSRTNNVQEAEDLTSQTFIKGMSSLPQLRHDDRFKSWLFSIARNIAMDYFRQQKRQPEIITDDPLAVAEQNDLVAGLIQSDRARHLSSILQTLEEKDLELLRLRIFGELTFWEVAETLHRSPQAVKKSYYRLLARLKSQLEEKYA